MRKQKYSPTYYQKNKERISKRQHEYYLKNKEKIIKKTSKRKKSEEELKRWKHYYKEVWYPNNKDRMKKLMLKQYHNHRDKWYSRSKTHHLLNYSKENKKLLIKECERCGGKKDLHLHYETYPSKKEEVIKAIKENKLYYLCKSCRLRRVV
jgi:hypothetical protein